MCAVRERYVGMRDYKVKGQDQLVLKISLTLLDVVWTQDIYYCIFMYKTSLAIHGYQELTFWTSYEFLRAKKPRLCPNFQKLVKKCRFKGNSVELRPYTLWQ